MWELFLYCRYGSHCFTCTPVLNITADLIPTTLLIFTWNLHYFVIWSTDHQEFIIKKGLVRYCHILCDTKCLVKKVDILICCPNNLMRCSDKYNSCAFLCFSTGLYTINVNETVSEWVRKICNHNNSKMGGGVTW